MQVHAYRRTQSALVDLVEKAYKFEPNAAGHVVCEVPEGAHLKRLLSITEAYRPYDSSFDLAAYLAASKGAAAAPQTSASAGSDEDEDDDENKQFTDVLKGSPDLPATFEIAAGVDVTQVQVVEGAFQRSGMTREAWNLNDEDDREGLIEQEVTHLRLAEEAKAKAAADATAGAGAPAGGTPAADAPKFVLKKGDETVDLGAMTEKQVRDFAKANTVKLPGGKSTKVDDLRAMVVKALTGV